MMYSCGLRLVENIPWFFIHFLFIIFIGWWTMSPIDKNEELGRNVNFLDLRNLFCFCWTNSTGISEWFWLDFEVMVKVSINKIGLCSNHKLNLNKRVQVWIITFTFWLIITSPSSMDCGYSHNFARWVLRLSFFNIMQIGVCIDTIQKKFDVALCDLFIMLQFQLVLGKKWQRVDKNLIKLVLITYHYG